jgi:putative transposase
LACARLGIALIHSKPYDSPSRGKIERFFRTVRAKFLATLPNDQINSLEQLNQLFERWLEKEYHKYLHTGIGQTPMERYIQDLKHTSTTRVAEEELDRAFQVTIKRTVKNDATVSVNSKSYECPHRFIGKTVEIRYPSDKPQQLMIYQDDKPVVQLKQVQLHQNANVPAWAIRFNKEDKEDKG